MISLKKRKKNNKLSLHELSQFRCCFQASLLPFLVISTLSTSGLWQETEVCFYDYCGSVWT